jgi:ankyrin repeat protein
VSSPILGHGLTYFILDRFRWVYCQLEVLQHCFGSSIRQTLDQLPETLDDTYAWVLRQIPPVNRANAHRMLQCLMVAVRPLRVEELAELLAFEFGTARAVVPKYRADWRPNDQVQAVQSTCSSLISIVDDNDSQIVQFSHFSVKEFLMSNRLTSSLGDFSQYQILPRPAHTVLAQACLGYLLHFDGHVDEEIIKGFPLAEYAAEHWVTHAQFEDVASCVKGGMETLLDCDKPHFEAWLRIYNMDGEFSPESPYKIPTPLYYSSLCGFSDMAEHLSTKHPEHVSALGGMYKFPLLAALAGNHIQVAEILLKHGANVDIRGLGERNPLHEAIIGRSVGIVQSLLDKGADVNCRQDDHRTPLHLAAYYGELKVARVLIEHKADVDSRDKEGKTPLYILLEVSRHDDDDILDLAQFLLEHCTDVNVRTTNEWTLLHEAAFGGILEIVRVLFGYGANPSAENDEGKTPLHLASWSWRHHSEERGVSIVRLLLEHAVNVNARDKYGWTSLHCAAFIGRAQVTRVLLDHGANAKLETEGGETALHTVSRGGFDSQEQGVSTARLLLERGVDVNAWDKNGWTSLHWAAFNGRVEVTKVLLDHGANAKLETEEGETALHIVSRGVYDSQEQGVSTALLLLERGVDVNARDKSDWTSLHRAAFEGRVEVALFLLDHGANAKLETKGGETALHVVSRCVYDSQEQGVSTALLLLERGVDVNARDKKDWTSLHRAAFEGRVEVAHVLLDHGSNANLETDEGETALHIVSRGKYISQEQGDVTARLLLEHGVDVNARQKAGWTSLHLAAFNGRVEVAQVLLDHGANTKLETDEGETALHVVSRGVYDSEEQGVGTARLLLERGMDVNARRKDGWTTLHWAAFKGRVEVAQVLLDHGANTKLETDEGETALHVVSRGVYDSQEQGVSTALLLRERGVDVNARDKKGWTSLHWAAFNGRVEVAQVLLDCFANTKLETDEGDTALHIVSRGVYDSEEQGVGTARLLLERGMDVNARRKDGWTTLHWAAFKGRVEVAQVLLDHGANTKLETDEGETALHVVSRGVYDSQEQGVSTALLLRERGVDVNARDKKGWTSLHWAAFNGRVEVAQVLLDCFANTKLETDEGDTALHIVSRGVYDSEEQGVGTARLLLERGMDVNARRKDGWTTLHWAAFKGRVEVAQVLLDHGANTKFETDEGETALHVVSRGVYDSQEQGVSTVLLLLKRGVDVNALDKKGWTSLHWAAFKGRVKVAQVLLDHVANTKLETDEGDTALHLVSRGEYDSEEQGVSTARLLLERGVDVNARRKDGWTALHWAAFNGRVYDSQEQGVRTALLLLERGVDVNARDKNGWTSLHLAAFNGRVEVTKVLLDHGANAKLETKEGDTALHIMSEVKYDSEERRIGIAQLLLEHGVNIHAENGFFATALHHAAYDGRFNLVQLFLDRGANPNAESDQGRTPLHAVSQGKYESQEKGVGIAQLLLERGVNVDARGKDKATPLHWAAFYGKLEIVQVRLFFLKNNIHLYSGTTGASRQRRKRKRGEP